MQALNSQFKGSDSPFPTQGLPFCCPFQLKFFLIYIFAFESLFQKSVLMFHWINLSKKEPIIPASLYCSGGVSVEDNTVGARQKLC